MPKSPTAREAVKNGRRARRHGRKPWMDGKPVMKRGPGGTDKPTARNNGKPPRYSQA